jgi:hypothetical protein
MKAGERSQKVEGVACNSKFMIQSPAPHQPYSTCHLQPAGFSRPAIDSQRLSVSAQRPEPGTLNSEPKIHHCL